MRFGFVIRGLSHLEEFLFLCLEPIDLLLHFLRLGAVFFRKFIVPSRLEESAILELQALRLVFVSESARLKTPLHRLELRELPVDFGHLSLDRGVFRKKLQFGGGQRGNDLSAIAERFRADSIDRGKPPNEEE
jgi:hypothetical protein